MSDLTNQEKLKLERLLLMESGYVLDFSDRKFANFIDDTVKMDISGEKYNYGSGSKANRLRGFWNKESNYVVAKLLRELITHGQERGLMKNAPAVLLEECRHIISRLEQTTLVPELDALQSITEEKDFEVIAREVRDLIIANKFEAGLDRLHTFVIKFVRALCEKRGLPTNRNKPLHSQFGEYVKKLRSDKHLESSMSERILKSSISILEAFNDVRNDHSLAHDNELLTYDESLLIFNHIAASVSFLRSLEDRLDQRASRIAAVGNDIGDIPF